MGRQADNSLTVIVDNFQLFISGEHFQLTVFDEDLTTRLTNQGE